MTNASRTMLMDIETLEWDEGILATLGIPRAMLPAIKSSSEVYGTGVGVLEGVRLAGASVNLPVVCGLVVAVPATVTMAMVAVHTHTPITRLIPSPHQRANPPGMLGDQQSALFGQTCFQAGQAKATYGTGAFLLLNTGHTIVPSERGLLTTLAFKLGKNNPVYALEGKYMRLIVSQGLGLGMGVCAAASDHLLTHAFMYAPTASLLLYICRVHRLLRLAHPVAAGQHGHPQDDRRVGSARLQGAFVACVVGQRGTGLGAGYRHINKNISTNGASNQPTHRSTNQPRPAINHSHNHKYR